MNTPLLTWCVIASLVILAVLAYSLKKLLKRRSDTRIIELGKESEILYLPEYDDDNN